MVLLHAILYTILIGVIVYLYMAKRDLEPKVYKREITGLWNRRGLEMLGARIFSEFQRGVYEHVSLAYIDLDKFKPINDQFGHDAGDQVLQTLADILSKSVRDLDIVAHPAGDEFIVVLPGTTCDIAKIIMGRARAQFEQVQFPFNTDKNGERIVKVSFTFGVVSTYQFGQTLEELMEAADLEMNRRKNAKGPRRIE